MDPKPSAQYQGTERAELYAKYRPKVPRVVIDRIVDYLHEKYDGELNLAVDAGCGSGQCTSALAGKFAKVLAMDISEAQINAAKSMPHPQNIEYRQGPVETIPVESGSVQLVNASQAAHYFDLPTFYVEVDRVLCPNGVIALSAYSKSEFDNHGETVSKEMARLVREFSSGKLGPYSVAELGVADRGYIDIVLPFMDSVREEIKVNEQISLADYGNFVRSWCPYHNYCQVLGEAAGRQILDELIENLRVALQTDSPPEEVTLNMTRTFYLLMGRKS